MQKWSWDDVRYITSLLLDIYVKSGKESYFTWASSKKNEDGCLKFAIFPTGHKNWEGDVGDILIVEKHAIEILSKRSFPDTPAKDCFAIKWTPKGSHERLSAHAKLDAFLSKNNKTE